MNITYSVVSFIISSHYAKFVSNLETNCHSLNSLEKTIIFRIEIQ